MKCFSALPLALLLRPGAAEVVGSDVRGPSTQGRDDAEGRPRPRAPRNLRLFDENDPQDREEGDVTGTLLARVARGNGAKVEFYEPEEGFVVVVSEGPDGEEDPLKEFLASRGGAAKDLGEFFDVLSGGSEPPAALVGALRRRKEHQSDKRAHYRKPRPTDNLAEDEEDEGDVDGQVAEGEGEGEGERHRRLICAERFLQKHCRFTKRLNWCRCRTNRTGRSQYTVNWAGDYYHTVSVYGGRISHKVSYQRCKVPEYHGYTRVCTWHTVQSRAVDEGYWSTVGALSDRAYTMRGNVYHADGDGDAYHWVAYDIKESDPSCEQRGEACHLCGNNDVQ